MRATRLREILIVSPLIFIFVATLSIHAQPSVGIPEGVYKKWLEEDVRWIISDQERADFQKLATDDQRHNFVTAFWDRRNPIPGAAVNTCKEEHYRRLAYANEHFAAGIPGWKTDRGRFYIMYGPPDKVERRLRFEESLPNGITRQTNLEEWHWSYIEGLGCDVVLEFVDSCECGEYHLTQGNSDLKTRRDLGSGCLINQILFPDGFELFQVLLPILSNPTRALPRHQTVVGRLVHQQLHHALHLIVRRIELS